MSGYLLLTASTIFLLHVAYQAIRLRVFDDVVAAVVGVLAINCLLALGLISGLGRHGQAATFMENIAPEVSGRDDRPALPIHSVASKDGINV